MEAIVGWTEVDPVKASVELGDNSIEISYSEDDGSKYNILLKSTDGITYKGNYLVTDLRKQRSGRIDPSKYQRKGTITAKMFSNEFEVVLFGRMNEDGENFHWWVDADKE